MTTSAAGRVLLLALAIVAAFAPVGAVACGFPAGVLPPGSYAFSCENCQMNGPDLVCQCRTISGDLQGTSIDVTNCETDPANDNGRLVCTACAGTRACCLESGACQERAPLSCQALGGSEGEGLTCQADSCEPAGDLMTWVGGRTGAFADPESWEPEKVPECDEDDHCDTALVRGGRNVVIDLDAAPSLLSARAPSRAATRRIGRLVVDQSRDLRPVDGTLQVDAISPLVGERSLELSRGASLWLDGAGLEARHVAVGAVGDGEIDVAGDLGLFETSGRLGLGVGGSGILRVSGGATVVSAEGVLGESEAPGTAYVEGQASLWTTGNLAVGLEADGRLAIEDGGKVESDTGVIDFNLGGDRRGRVEVRGATAGGTPSEWRLGALDVGPRGSVSVEDGGRVEVTGPLRIGFEGAPHDCFAGRACVEIRGGVVQAPGGVVVGESGGGAIEIGPAGTLAAGGEFLLGPDYESARVRIEGPSAGESVFTDLGIGTGEESSAELRLDPGALLDLIGRFRVGGGEGSLGRFTLVGDPESPDTLASVFEGDAFDSLVGGGSASVLTGILHLEHARLELSGAGHGLVIQRDGWLRSDGGTVAIESPTGLVNRGLIRGGLTVEGNYVQEATGELRGLVLAARGTQAAARGRARAAAPPPPFEPVVVTGDAALAGRARLQFGGGVAPKLGERFDLLEVQGEVSGAFDEVEIAGLVPGSFAFDPSLVGGKLALVSTKDALALPAVSVKAKARLKETAKKGGKIKLKRTGDTSAPLVVGYRVGGTARSGVDYEALPGTIEIPARKKSATIVVKPLADGLAEGPETIEIELAPDAAFAPGVVSSATIELISKDE